MVLAEGTYDYGPPAIGTYSGANSPKITERAQLTSDVDDLLLANLPAAAPANGRSAWRPARKQVTLIVATIIVDALAPLMQERAARRRGFEGSTMVLAETMSYFLGGLTLAVMSGGVGGFWRCVRPTRYLAFLPASAAFSTSNFLTYVAVRGLGASQFYLLAQLRVAVLAVFLRIWTGARQPSLAWLSLVQLAVGVVVLVYFRANAMAACTLGVAPDMMAVMGNATALRADPTPRGLATAARVAAQAASSRSDFISSIFALVGVVFASAFAFIYLEWQLKTNLQDPLFVQLHQMNSFGAVVSLLIHLGHATSEASGPTSQQGLEASAAIAAGVVENRSSFATNATGLVLQTLTTVDGQPTEEGSPLPMFFMLICCVISRGVLSGSVLKNLDSIAKGLIDVTAIVVCTGIQFTLAPDSADGTVVGIQMLMLLSILSYIVARSSGPSSSVVAQVNNAGNSSISPSTAPSISSAKAESVTVHATSSARAKQRE